MAKNRIIGIALSPHGVYIGTDLAMRVYYWNHIHCGWVELVGIDEGYPIDA